MMNINQLISRCLIESDVTAQRSAMTEELSPSQARQVDTWEPTIPDARARTDAYFGVGVDIKNKEIIDVDYEKSAPHLAIEDLLGHKVLLKDYIYGRLPNTDKEGKSRPIKIGKFLISKNLAGKNDKLLNSFNNDPARSGKNLTGLSIHDTRSAVGVAGQASGEQSWLTGSCKNFETGGHRDKLKGEVKYGTVVSYLKDKDGKEISRATFQPYHSHTGMTIYVLNGHYGIRNTTFDKHIDDMEEALSCGLDASNDIYHIDNHVYDNHFGAGALHPKTTHDNITNIINNKDLHRSVRAAAIRHKNATDVHISKVINDKYEHDDVKISAISHRNASEDNITEVLNDKSNSWALRKAAIKNRSATNDHISSILDDKNEDWHVRKAAITHNKAAVGHISQVLANDYEDWRVIKAAVSHNKATAGHISQVLKDKNIYWKAQLAAIMNKNSTLGHVQQVLDNKDAHHEVHKAAAARHNEILLTQ